MADSNSGPESQTNTHQQGIILDEQLCISPKTLKDRKKMRVGSVQIKLKHNKVIELRLIKGIGDNFRAIAIVVQL